MPKSVTAPIPSLTITFSEAVTKFSLANLKLTRNNAIVSLNAASLMTTDGGKTWVLGNLAGLTNIAGSYVLSISGKPQDLAGNVMKSSPNRSWKLAKTIAL